MQLLWKDQDNAIIRAHKPVSSCRRINHLKKKVNFIPNGDKKMKNSFFSRRLVAPSETLGK